MISDKKLEYCENGIFELAKGLDIPEERIVKILRAGMEVHSILEELSESDQYFINEMEASFCEL